MSKVRFIALSLWYYSIVVIVVTAIVVTVFDFEENHRTRNEEELKNGCCKN